MLQLGGEFLPHLEEGNLWIRASMPPTISLDAGFPYVNRMREVLLRHPEVITVVSQHGRPDDGSDAAGFNNVELFAPLKPLQSVAQVSHQGEVHRRFERRIYERVHGH